MNFFISRGEESYSPETLALFVKTVQENFVNGAIQKASFQTMRKAAHWIEEYLSTGQVSQQKLRKYNFACAPPEFENLLSQYQLYIIEHFGNADAVPHTEPQRGASERNRRLRRLLARRSAGAVLKPSGGNCAVLPKLPFGKLSSRKP